MIRTSLFVVVAGITFGCFGVGELRAQQDESGKEAADAKSTEANAADEGKESGKPGDVNLAKQQGRIAEKYARLEDLMFKMAEFEAGNNIDRAKLLKQAYRQSKEQLTRTQLEKIAGLLGNKKLKQAVDGQKQAQSDIQDLLTLLLSENRSDRLKRDQDIIRNAIKEIERLQRLQKSVRGRTEGGADPDRLGDEQGKIANRTGDLIDKLQELEGSGQSGGEGEGGSEGDSKGGSEGDSKGESEGDSKGDSEGDSKGDSEGDSKGDSEGDSKGDSEGDSKGDSEGDSKGDSEGDSKGDSEGDSKGDSEGDSKGDSEGDSKGDSEGDSKGDSEGDSKGDSEGDSKGDSEGDSKGDSEGDSKGDSEGDSKGDSEGDSKGDSQGDSKGGSQPGQENQEQPSTQDRVKAAKERMERAQRRLEEAKRKEAVEEQIKAEEELAKAKAELEEILRQLREEELKRMLADLETRFTRMLKMQLKVYEGTRRLSQIPKSERDREIDIRSNRLSFEEKKIVGEADRALTLLRDDGSSVAFPEAVEQMLEDMIQVVERLADTKVDRITQGIEEDIIEALEEMIVAVQKAQQEMEEGESGGGGGGGGGGDQPLVDQIAELKMIRALQMRVNKRTQRYARLLDDEEDLVGQAKDDDLRDALDRLGGREDKIQRVTRDVVLGKNK